MRLFVAVDLPDNVKKQVENLCSGLRGVRWVKPEQMHLTMRFIGEVNNEQYQRIKTALGQIQFSPFELGLHGVGQFSLKKTPRVIWVGLTESPALADLARQVEKTVVALGFPPEDKPFSPHITLARIKLPPSINDLEHFYSKNAAFQTETFSINEFILYSSTLTPAGSIYKKEAVYEAR